MKVKWIFLSFPLFFNVEHLPQIWFVLFVPNQAECQWARSHTNRPSKLSHFRESILRTSQPRRECSNEANTPQLEPVLNFNECPV